MFIQQRANLSSSIERGPQLYTVTLEGCRGGIGLSLTRDNVVIAVEPNTAAAAHCGTIRAGDRLVRLDGVIDVGPTAGQVRVAVAAHVHARRVDTAKCGYGPLHFNYVARSDSANPLKQELKRK